MLGGPAELIRGAIEDTDRNLEKAKAVIREVVGDRHVENFGIAMEVFKAIGRAALRTVHITPQKERR